MQGQQNNSNPLGIFQRFFAFLNNTLVTRGFKRVTLGQPLPQAGSTKLLVDDSLSSSKFDEKLTVNFKDHDNSKHDPDSDIQVLFMRAEVPESDKFADQSQMHMDSKTSHHVLKKRKEKGKTVSEQLPGESSQLAEPRSTTVATSRGPKKIVDVKDITEEEKNKMTGKSREPKESEEKEKNKLEGNSIPSKTSRWAMQNEEPTMTPRRLRPLLDVAPNINEKSDAFINSRKRALGLVVEARKQKDLNYPSNTKSQS